MTSKEMLKMIIIIILLSIALSSCSQNRTYLTDKERNWNPYEKGQVLIFESSDNKLDSILIEDIKVSFPDGLGVVDYYEILTTVARHTNFKEDRKASTYCLTVAAKTSKRSSYVEFGLETRNAQFIERQRYSFEDLRELAEIKLAVPYGTFYDVITIVNKKDYASIPSAIEIIYWSKSKGYIRFDKYDGTSWKLVEIIGS